jgi:hypothetical protein
MNCWKIQESLVDLLYGEVGAEERSRLLTHLDACRDCRERWNRLRAVVGVADLWTPPPLPRGIAERALARVASERVREARGAWAAPSLEQILKGVLFGAGAAAVSLLLVAGVIERPAAPFTVGVLGVLWTALYAAVILTGFQTRLRPLAWSALTGGGAAMILMAPLSIPRVVEACARLIQAAPASLPFALLLLLFATGYTAGPLLVAGAAFGRVRRDQWIRDGMTLSLLYALLIAPAVYLQCLDLPLNVTAVWMAGAVLGASLAGPVSLRLTWPRAVAA